VRHIRHASTEAMRLVREHRAAFIAIHAGYLGLFLVGIGLTAVIPELRPGGLGALGADTGAQGVGTVIADAYRSGNVALAAAVTLAVNLLLASIVQTTLPSLVVPFLGVLLTLARALSWGVLFTPFGAQDSTFLIHYVTLAIEGAAYATVGFAAWVQGRRVVQPQRFGLPTRRAGWLAGLRATASLYLWVVVLLIVGALYEAVTVIAFIA